MTDRTLIARRGGRRHKGSSHLTESFAVDALRHLGCMHEQRAIRRQLVPSSKQKIKNTWRVDSQTDGTGAIFGSGKKNARCDRSSGHVGNTD